MSMILITKKCPKCGKTYHFNPDVGKGLCCPHCAGLGIILCDGQEEKTYRGKK